MSKSEGIRGGGLADRAAATVGEGDILYVVCFFFNRERGLCITQIINIITLNFTISALYKMNSKVTEMSKNC
jgi:hypothetical protein